MKRWNDTNKRPVSCCIKNVEEASSGMDIDMEEKKDDTKNRTTTKQKSNRQYKYMTNSQLLHLQLQDPEIRIHILTQLLIITSFLSSSLKSDDTLNKMTLDRICDDLERIEAKASEILKSTPPNGESHYLTLKWVLQERETIWKTWKKEKCQAKIEQHYEVSESKENSEADDREELAKKRRELMGGSLGANGSSTTESSSLSSLADLYSYKIDVKTELPDISMSIMKKHKPDTFDFLEDYVEALDPEAGIEEEYHPKNDKLFAWRAMRLLNEKHVGSLGIDHNGHAMINLHNGDFEGLVRKIWKKEKNMDVPGEMPVADKIVDHEEEEEENDQEEVVEEYKDEGEKVQALDKEERKIVDDAKMDVDESEVGKSKVNEVVKKSPESKQKDIPTRSAGQKRKRNDEDVTAVADGDEKKVKSEEKVETQATSKSIESQSQKQSEIKSAPNSKEEDQGSKASSTIPTKEDTDNNQDHAPKSKSSVSSTIQVTVNNNVDANTNGTTSSSSRKEEKNETVEKSEEKSVNRESQTKKVDNSNKQNPSVKTKSSKVETKANTQRSNNQPVKPQQSQSQQNKAKHIGGKAFEKRGPQFDGRQARSQNGQQNHGTVGGRQQRQNQMPAAAMNRRNDDRRGGGGGGGGGFQNQNHNQPPQGRGGMNMPRTPPNDGHQQRGHHGPQTHQPNHDNRRNQMNRRSDGRRFEQNNPGRFRDDRGRRGNQGGSGGGQPRRGGGGRR